MDISITLLNGEEHILTVAPGTTVGSLKDLISQRFQVSPESQKLSYNKDGQQIMLDNDLTSLSFYGVSAGAKILMLVKGPNEPTTYIELFLKTEKGQTHTYNVPPGETVAGFKLKVQQRERMAVDQQRLVHEGKKLDNGSRTLESYNVRKESTIYLTGGLRGG